MIQNSGMEIRANIGKIPLLSKFIGNSMFKYGLGEYTQFQVQIAVEEIVNNIIKCGKLHENDKISVKCQKEDNEIKIFISYPGKMFNPSMPNSSSLKGKKDCLKIYFTRKNFNRINHEFDDGKNLLTLIKNI